MEKCGLSTKLNLYDISQGYCGKKHAVRIVMSIKWVHFLFYGELFKAFLSLTLVAHCAQEYFAEIGLLMNTWMLIYSHFPSAVPRNLSVPPRVLFQSHYWNHNRVLVRFCRRAFWKSFVDYWRFLCVKGVIWNFKDKSVGFIRKICHRIHEK